MVGCPHIPPGGIISTMKKSPKTPGCDTCPDHADGCGKGRCRHCYRDAVVRRLSRATGHLEAIRKMVAEDRECLEVLVQLSAVRSALSACSKLILEEHICEHVRESVAKNDLSPLQELGSVMDKIL